MTAETTTQLTPPDGFRYNPDSLDDYDEQVRFAVERAAERATSIPSFEGVPQLDIRPTFNPSGAPKSEIYAHGRQPRTTQTGKRLRSDQTDSKQPVEVWRLLERSKLEDGTGLVSSRVLLTGSLGDIENYDDSEHYHSYDALRTTDPKRTSPYVSFSTDPANLAKNLVLQKGQGVKGGRDSVVVRALVAPDRVLTGTAGEKEPEVVLVGGLAPDEYQAAYSVEDFVNTMVPDQEITTMHGDTLPRDKVLGYWAIHA
jgi:hypothetical protein